jgi:RNA polymerase sigma-70 factor (ECF subfamily)
MLKAPTQHPHHALIEACRSGNEKAQFKLYQHYKDYLYNLCTRMLVHQSEAEDALQDAFLEAFTRIENLQENRAFGSWIKQITVRKCVDRLRRKNIQIESLEEKEFAIADVAKAPMEESGAEIQSQKLHQEIKSLPDGCRSIFTLYELEGYDHGEIAQILEVSESTSKTQLHRARKILRQKLSVHP